MEISDLYWKRLESVNKREVLSVGWDRYGQIRI